jgi:hypothetical protein
MALQCPATGGDARRIPIGRIAAGFRDAMAWAANVRFEFNSNDLPEAGGRASPSEIVAVGSKAALVDTDLKSW